MMERDSNLTQFIDSRIKNAIYSETRAAIASGTTTSLLIDLTFENSVKFVVIYQMGFSRRIAAGFPNPRPVVVTDITAAPIKLVYFDAIGPGAILYYEFQFFHIIQGNRMKLDFRIEPLQLAAMSFSVNYQVVYKGKEND